MEFLKRNGMGLAAILCCCVLGVLLAQQSGQLQGLRQENVALTGGAVILALVVVLRRLGV